MARSPDRVIDKKIELRKYPESEAQDLHKFDSLLTCICKFAE